MEGLLSESFLPWVNPSLWLESRLLGGPFFFLICAYKHFQVASFFSSKSGICAMEKKKNTLGELCTMSFLGF